jgi:aryl carrier-like protein
VEETLARLWQELLKVERVGRRDNFFALGGHSLVAVTLMERMRRQALQANQALGAELDVTDIFESPTLGELAARIRERVERLDDLPG